MTPERAAWLLAHPADYAQMVVDPKYREYLPQPDGALLTVILAVDR
jgi:hypothetical protein